MEYVKMSLPAIMTYLIKVEQLNHTEAGTLIGVTPLQIRNYRTGATKKPKPTICKAIYDKVIIDGKHALVDIYTDVASLERHCKLQKL